jgi:glutamyl-tRNA synthetase
MEWDKLWTINKKIIDPVCPRHTAVVTEGKVLLTLSNGPQEPLVKVSLCFPCILSERFLLF